MLIQVTLSIPAGSSVGPFDLFSDVDNYTTAFQTNVAASELTSGYAVDAPEGSTVIRVKSVGVCTTSIDLPNNCIPAPTPVPVPVTPVPTAPVPVPTAPVPTTPVPTAPVPTTPVPTTPVPTAPVPTTPVPTAPVPTTPVPTAPVPVPTPVPVTPVPTTPVPTTPVPTTPVPTAPVPTTPVPTAPVPTTPVPTAPVPTTPVPVPVTPVPVTPNYTYYFAEPCGGGSTIYIRSVSPYSQGEAVKVNGFGSTCYEVGTSGAPVNSNEAYERFPDCSACAPTPVPVPVTPVPTAVTYRYYFVEQCSPGTSDRVARTPNSLNVNLNPNLANSFTYFGSCYFVKNTATKANYDNNDGDLSAIDISGYSMLNGCSECTGPAPTAPVPSAPTLRVFSTHSTIEQNSINACNRTINSTKYHDGNNTYPQLGNICYNSSTTSSGTIAAGYWRLLNETWIRTDASGQVIQVGSCATPVPVPVPVPVPATVTCKIFRTGPMSTFSGVCQAIGFNQHGHTGQGSYPTLNDTVYETNSCSTVLAAGYYHMDNGNYIRVAGGGNVIDTGSCDGGDTEPFSQDNN